MLHMFLLSLPYLTDPENRNGDASAMIELSVDGILLGLQAAFDSEGSRSDVVELRELNELP